MVSKRSAGRSASILSYFSTEWGGGGVLPYMGYMSRDRVWFLEVLDP